MAARTLIHFKARARVGEVIDIQTTIGHVMETGFRSDAEGRPVPRDILTRFVCRFDGEPVIEVDLFPAISANPYLAFCLRVERSGELQFEWLGDQGFVHRETRALEALP